MEVSKPRVSAGTTSWRQQSRYMLTHDEKTRKARRKIGLKSRRRAKTPRRKRSMVTVEGTNGHDRGRGATRRKKTKA